MTVIEEKVFGTFKRKSKLAHDLAEFYFENVWNEAIIALDKTTHKKQITGTDTLSYLSTIIFILQDAGYKKCITRLHLKMMLVFLGRFNKRSFEWNHHDFGGKAEYEKNDYQMGIKKLKKQALS